MAKSPEEMTAAMVANLKEKTGKSLEQWLRIAKASGLEKHGQIVKHLKAEHGLGHGYANLVAAKRLEAGAPPPAGEDLLAAQYAGKKACLKPIHDALVSLVTGLGKDVELAPKKTYLSLRRSKQFGLVQPSTATRVDLGLCLKGVEPEGRLEAAGSFNSMVTHRIRLESPKDVDGSVERWLKKAYELA